MSKSKKNLAVDTMEDSIELSVVNNEETVQDYEKLNDKCDKVINKVKVRKLKSKK